jgi:hypothetical protein
LVLRGATLEVQVLPCREQVHRGGLAMPADIRITQVAKDAADCLGGMGFEEGRIADLPY